METFAEMDIKTNFTALDWGIVAVYLLVMLLIGTILRKYIINMTDFVVAGRSMKAYLGIATMIASEMGLVTVMYAAQMGYNGGFSAFHVGVIALIMTLMVGLTGFIVVPLRRTGAVTIPEYYQMRWGSRGLRIFGGVVLAFAGILNMGLFIKAGALFVGGVTGLTDEVQWKTIMTIMLAIVLTYTVFGGMVSVVITDYIQFVLLSVGILMMCLIPLFTLGFLLHLNRVAPLWLCKGVVYRCVST
jgi:SSS family solute:Na+ symporter